MNDKNKIPPQDNTFGRLPAARIPRAERTQVMWSWVAVLAMVFILGVTFYAIDARQDSRSTPQATATTSASGRTAVPAADQTPAMETTGRGGSNAEPRTGDETAR